MLNSQIHISLVDAMQRASKPLQRKMQKSIELLQKAESLALRYDSDGGYFLAFSGGKDSQALYHIAKLAGVKFNANINFTSVDPPQVVRFVHRQYPDVICHAPKKSIYDLAVDRGILPSMRIRWCCADLKEQAGAGKVTLIGIRKQESTRRAKRHEVEVSNRQFSGSLDEFRQWQEAKIKEKEEKLMKKMKKEGKKVNEDFFSADKENEVRCINGKDSILISPIFEWTDKEVWEFLNNVVQVEHCELYDKGYKRIGCILCPMSRHKQKLRELKDFPYVKSGWIRAIKRIRKGGEITRQTYQCEILPIRMEHHVSAIGNGSTTTGGNYPPEKNLAPKSQHRNMGGWIQCPDNSHWTGFRIAPSLNGNRGQNEPTEDEIAEKIFNWWISGKSYEKWYAETYLQTKIEFE